MCVCVCVCARACVCVCAWVCVLVSDYVGVVAGMDSMAKTELVEGLHKLLESAGLLSSAPPTSLAAEDEADFQCKLSRLVNGMGVTLVTSWTK